MKPQSGTYPLQPPQHVTAPEPTVSFDKRGCGPLLRKHPSLQGKTARTIRSQIGNGLFKSKFATMVRWQGLPIWECRVNEQSVGSVRAAYVVNGSAATVLYLSATLQKRAFAAELDRFLKRGQR